MSMLSPASMLNSEAETGTGDGTDGPPSDRALLSSWRNVGRTEDFTELVRRHFHLVRGIARRQLGEDLAEDTAQTVFTILARKAPDARCLSAWLHRVTVLQCRDAVRRKLREKRAQLAAMEIASLSEARDPLEDARPHIDAAIAALDERDRELLLLRYSEGLSFTAAAARTGRAEPALRKQAGRALEKLSLLLRRRGVSVPTVALASGLGGVLGSPPAAQAAAVAATAVAGAGALSGFSLLSITLITMTTIQSLAAGAATAAVLSAIPLGWQTWQLHHPPPETAILSSSFPSSSSPPGANASLSSEAGKNPPAAAASIATPAEPSDDVMEELEKAMTAEAESVMRNWAISNAWTESRSLAMVLGLSPERESALRTALTKFLEKRATAVLGGDDHAVEDNNDEDDGTKTGEGKNRRKYRKERDAWLKENLNPEELTKLKAYDAAQREALIAAKSEEALHWISSKVELTEDQKTRLFNAGAARTAQELDKDQYGGSLQFTGTLQSAPSPPVEETAAGVVAGVLDPAQRQLWEESAARLKYATEDMPRRLVDRAFEIIRQRGLLSVMAAMMNQMIPPSEPAPESRENAKDKDKDAQ